MGHLQNGALLPGGKYIMNKNLLFSTIILVKQHLVSSPSDHYQYKVMHAPCHFK